MSIRFRFGPFTIGRTGLRLSFWRKVGGISTPVFGSSKQTFGILRAGPLRWHFSKRLFGGRPSQETGACGLPTKSGLYQCPQCHRYAARKINSIGKLKLKCVSCGCTSKLRSIQKIKRGWIFRRTIARQFHFAVFAPK